MAATILDATNSSTATGTTLTVALPSTRPAGQLLIMLLGWWGGLTATGLTGWSLEASVGGTAQRIACYTRVIDGSESATYVVGGFSASGDPRAATVLRISGHSGLDGVQVAATNSSATTNWATAPSITTAGADETLVFAAFSQAMTNTVTWTWAGSPTVAADFQSAAGGGYYGHLSAASQVQATAGASGTRSLSRSASGNSDDAGLITLAIKNPSAGGGASSSGQFFVFF